MKDSQIPNILLSPFCRAGKAYTDEETSKLTQEINEKTINNIVSVAITAFPLKIGNPLKTDEISMWYGEQISLQRLKIIKEKIEAIGDKLDRTIITDGTYYADELGVEKNVATKYSHEIRNFATEIWLDATFVELNDLVKDKPLMKNPMSWDDPDEYAFVVRTAGMINSMQYTSELQEAFEKTQNVSKAIESLLATNLWFRTQAEESAGLYQQRKLAIEKENIFEKYFPDCVRASIQPKPNRNTKDFQIARPLSIRLTESKRKNLFPRLWVPCKGKENYNIYLAEAKKKWLSFNGLYYE